MNRETAADAANGKRQAQLEAADLRRREYLAQRVEASARAAVAPAVPDAPSGGRTDQEMIEEDLFSDEALRRSAPGGGCARSADGPQSIGGPLRGTRTFWSECHSIQEPYWGIESGQT